MILVLVRHGMTPVTGKKLTGWLPGISLSSQGTAQARSAGERLAGAPIKAIYSSPLERCTETAELIAERHSLAVQTRDELGEVHYGDWQGKSLKVLYRSKLWSELKSRPGDFRFPNGETIREAQTRGMGAVETLRSQHKDNVVVVCSHADMIRLIVAGYLGMGIDLYSRISIAPASVTTLVLADSTPHLVVLGDTGSYQDLWRRANNRPTAKGRSVANQQTVPLEGEGA